MMDIGLIALLLLLLVVALGFWRKVNVGLLAIAGAAVLGYVSGQFSGKQIIGGFSASLFMTLLGVTLFFGIIQENGCIEFVMRRMVGVFGKQIWMAPVLVFAMGFIVAAIGPGCVPGLPQRWISPSDRSSNPAIMRRVVVLPQPDGPRKEKHSPS